MKFTTATLVALAALSQAAPLVGVTKRQTEDGGEMSILPVDPFPTAVPDGGAGSDNEAEASVPTPTRPHRGSGSDDAGDLDATVSVIPSPRGNSTGGTGRGRGRGGRGRGRIGLPTGVFPPAAGSTGTASLAGIEEILKSIIGNLQVEAGEGAGDDSAAAVLERRFAEATFGGSGGGLSSLLGGGSTGSSGGLSSLLSGLSGGSGGAGGLSSLLGGLSGGSGGTGGLSSLLGSGASGGAGGLSSLLGGLAGGSGGAGGLSSLLGGGSSTGSGETSSGDTSGGSSSNSTSGSAEAEASTGSGSTVISDGATGSDSSTSSGSTTGSGSSGGLASLLGGLGGSSGSSGGLASLLGGLGGSSSSGSGGLSSLLGGLTGGGASTDISSSSGACKGNTLIFARGTGEPSTMGFVVGPSLSSSLSKELGGDLAVQGVDYPAGAAGNAMMGRGEGATKMAAYANAALTKCPETKIILSGYSQGAMVVHAALNDGIDGSKVAGIAVFGDPLAGSAFKGVDKSKVVNVCGSTDFLCSRGGSTGSGGHMSYGGQTSATAQKLSTIVGSSS